MVARKHSVFMVLVAWQTHGIIGCYGASSHPTCTMEKHDTVQPGHLLNFTVLYIGHYDIHQ